MSEQGAYLFVRMKPYSPRKGFKVKRHDHYFNRPGSAYHGQWFAFTRAGLWFKVPTEVAEVLRLKRQDPYGETPPLFDVCTEEEARALDAQAEAEREAARALTEPSVDTAQDMTGRGDLALGDLALGDLAHSREAALPVVEPQLSQPSEAVPPPSKPTPKPTPKPATKPKAKPRAKVAPTPKRTVPKNAAPKAAPKKKDAR